MYVCTRAREEIKKIVVYELKEYESCKRVVTFDNLMMISHMIAIKEQPSDIWKKIFEMEEEGRKKVGIYRWLKKSSEKSEGKIEQIE